MPEENAVPQAPVQSFAERKAAQLREEREAQPPAGNPTTPQDLDPGIPSGAVESAVVEQDDPQALHADDLGSQGQLEEPGEDLPGDTLDPQGPTEQEPAIDWEKRYTDLQSATQVDRESRGEMEREHAESMSEHLRLRFDLEDKLKEAVGRAELVKNVMEGNAQQYQNINWAQVPPEKVAEVQAQAQQAFQMQQQATAAWEQAQSESDEVTQVVRQREAAIARTRLKRTIPGWSNEVYADLRTFAASAGMPAEAFNKLTDPVIIEWAYAAKQIAQGKRTLTVDRPKNKPNVPRGKAARRAPRDARGKFAKTQLEPNQRGSFANKHQHRLAMERQGR